ncbi:MAG: hypothetical protein JWM71_2330, partial [Solirubrobacteraceae bacterium]|nr:hypothetical protein [Solirubrobacteraceae bacterium]
GARAVTEVRVPRRAYPKGYVARVTSGRIHSAANASVLALTAHPGTAAVTVTLVPVS